MESVIPWPGFLTTIQSETAPPAVAEFPAVLEKKMYYLTFEDFDRSEDFRRYLKENTGIELKKARNIGDSEHSCYEFESFGYQGFVMMMVCTICFHDGIDYAEMGRLPQARKEKYLKNQLFSHAMSDVKVWRPPTLRSREFRWVSENLGLSENCIRNVVQRAEKKYNHWLEMDRRYSLLIGSAFLLFGVLFAYRDGPTSWPALLFFSFAAMLLIFCIAKTVQNRKKNRSRLP